ncbi:hypothetical protein I4641_06100 [Waterburya agarophytonicola K14]|uniref:Uncharacterized protein n=1 Tax=Waterburya agarophytonicola KI4 TaxID=2874699 RepID=A0A964FGF5_9CYAN|nr:hypothetical protein [Waterburya agarophytonicola]MCC0176549.1 hypothetical protein [Waterburya agarophytonicola KI4]
MGTLVNIAAIFACISILTGYLRFIVDENGNVPLNSYRFTGCLGMVLLGMVEGTGDLFFSHKITPNALSALMIYAGLGIFFMIFSLAGNK